MATLIQLTQIDENRKTRIAPIYINPDHIVAIRELQDVRTHAVLDTTIGTITVIEDPAAVMRLILHNTTPAPADPTPQQAKTEPQPPETPPQQPRPKPDPRRAAPKQASPAKTAIAQRWAEFVQEHGLTEDQAAHYLKTARGHYKTAMLLVEQDEE